MTNIVVSTFTPVLGSGRAVRSYGIVAALELLGPVELVYQRFGATEPAPEYERLTNLTMHAVEPSRGLSRIVSVARARREGAPIDLARAVSPQLGQAVAALHRPGDRVIADGPGAALTVLDLIGEHEGVYVAHNIEGDLDPRLRKLEVKLLERFGETWMATRADERRGKEIVPGARLRYAPNVVDVAAIDVPTVKPEGKRALFVADFSYTPNREGLRFLLDDVMPRVWEQLPKATLAVAGRGLDLEADDGRVEIMGFVEDLGDQYARASAVVVPLLSGGGSPLKLIEGLAYGRPVVATEHAAGLVDGARAGKNLLAAGGAAQFAELLATALKGKHTKVGQAGRELAEREYSIQALASHLQA